MSPLYISQIFYLRTSKKENCVETAFFFTEPRFFTSLGHSFLCAAPCLWNKLPKYVITAKSVYSFKTLLKTLIVKSDKDLFD